MSNSGQEMAEKLQRHRTLLLACEAIGWLHMTEKAHKDFLLRFGHAGIRNGENEAVKQQVYAILERLKWVAELNKKQKAEDPQKVSLLNWPESFADFIHYPHKAESKQDVVGCLQAGHAMASGIEKNVPNKPSEYLQQNARQMWLVTAFGHPLRNLLIEPHEFLTDDGWKNLIKQIRKSITNLKKLGEHRPRYVKGWWQWREAAIGSLGCLRRAFDTTLAETRVPNNDVSLWDQSYVASALFKSAVAGLILLEDLSDEAWENLKQKTRWRVLTVGIGTDHYEARAVRIGDWLGSRRAIESFFKDVCRLIEVDLAVGSLLYRDDQILAFSFPGQRSDDGDRDIRRSLDQACADRLCAFIEDKISRMARRYKLETPPLCRLSESTRSLLSIGREADDVRKALTIPVARPWKVAGKSGQGHVCPVCHARLGQESSQKYGREIKRRVCKVCLRRRRGRLNTWLHKGEDTIWISELADHNDRVALLTFGFDIEPWLDGTQVDSLRAQSVPEWLRFNAHIKTKKDKTLKDEIDIYAPTNALVKHVAGLIRSVSGKKVLKISDKVLESINDGYKHEESLENFYYNMVVDRADNPPQWDFVQNNPKVGAEWLVHQMFRKNASPGRTYRFWRTVERFFEELEPNLRRIVSAHSNRWRTRRLAFVPIEGSVDGFEDGESYATRWNDAPLELVYCNIPTESKSEPNWQSDSARENGYFITACNLARPFRPEDTSDSLNGKWLELKGTEHTIVRQVKLKVYSKRSWPGAYTPLIVLNRSPRRFRVMVPLEAVPACIELVKRKYETEFARVWDRMPLYVGVVGFSRMTPFQAVIEAVRNVEDALMRKKEEHWTVAGSYLRDGNCHLTMTRPDGVHETMAVPVTLPDGRPDVFYPYVAVTDADRRNPRDFAKPATEREKQVVYRHVADLAPNDTVHVAPSRFASVFMDSTALRFEPVEVHYLSEWRRLRETWEILRRNTRDITSLRRAWAYLADAQERWKSDDEQPQDRLALFTSYARTVLSDQIGVQPPVLDALVEAAVSGTLERTLDWHLRVLKLDLEDRWS